MLASQETQIVSTFIEEYKPEFDEETGEYYDECPYEKYKRSKKSYSCPCVSGKIINTRAQFIAHFKIKSHKNWLKNIGKKNDDNKIIKELRINNEKKEKQIRSQIRNLNLLSKHVTMLEDEIVVNKNAYENVLKRKNDMIAELKDNIELLEKITGHTVEYE